MNMWKSLWCVTVALAAVGCGKQVEPAVASAPTLSAPEPERYAKANPKAGGVEQVPVTAVGQGATLAAAVQSAIRSAIVQVNGESVDASSTTFQAGMAASFGQGNLDIASAGFAELVSTQSRGAITGFKLVSQRVISDKITEATIEAKVAKYNKPASADRLRVVVAPIRAASAAFTIDTAKVPASRVAQKIHEAVTEAMTQSGRVTVLDREFSGETDAELALIEGGSAAREDFAKLGQQLTADYVLIGRIEQFSYERHEQSLRTSDRVLVSHSGGASLALRLINTATGQVEQADMINISLPATAPTTLGTSVNAAQLEAELESQLAGQMSVKVIKKLFPITIVQIEGDDVILSQGAPAIAEGRQYEVIARGTELTDPQTGASLGRVEKPCCAVLVTKVTEQTAYGHFTRKDIDVAAAFHPGALEVTEGAAPSRSEVRAEAAVTTTETATKSRATQQGNKPSPVEAAKTPTSPEDPNSKNW